MQNEINKYAEGRVSRKCLLPVAMMNAAFIYLVSVVQGTVGYLSVFCITYYLLSNMYLVKYITFNS